MSGHACNARCDNGGHYLLEVKPKHRFSCTIPIPVDAETCESCERWTTGALPGYQPRHRAEVTP